MMRTTSNMVATLSCSEARACESFMSVGSQLGIQGGSTVKSCRVCVQSLWVAEVGSQIRVCALMEHRWRQLVQRRTFRNCQNPQTARSHHVLVGKGHHVQGLQRRQRPCHRMTFHCWWANVKGTDALRLGRLTSALVVTTSRLRSWSVMLELQRQQRRLRPLRGNAQRQRRQPRRPRAMAEVAVLAIAALFAWNLTSAQVGGAKAR